MSGAAWDRPEPSRALGGAWLVHPADESLRRHFIEDDFDDTAWATLDVPGHWQQHPDLARHQGSILHRHRFDAATPSPGERWWLCFDGVCYQGDVFLDGAYLGDTEGYVVRHAFEVTEQLTARSDHLLAVEVTCSPPGDVTKKRNITGSLQHWDALDPAVNPGGIWAPVTLGRTGPVRIHRCRVVVLEADSERAIVQVDATLDSAATHTVTVRTGVTPTGREADATLADLAEEHVLSAGENQLTWRLAVEHPQLWWPATLGGQPLHDVHVEVDLAGDVSDRARRRVGFRQVDFNDWTLAVNGEQLFLKGAGLGPRAHFGSATDDDLRADLQLAIDTGLDFVRLIGHIAHPRLYELADEMGVLIWQEFPLQWGYARGIRGKAMEQATAMVDRFGHHPSIFVWSAHNEPFPLEVRPGHRPDVEAGGFTRGGLLRQELPTWNRTVLDRSVKRSIEKADASRKVIAHSGVLPHPPQLDGTDSHLWFGWFHGDAGDLATLAARLPRMVRFVSEFGAQAPGPGWVPPSSWPPSPDQTQAMADSGLHVHQATGRFPFAASMTADDWADLLRRYQAALTKRTVETLRRLKYRPTGGFAAFLLVDSQPGISAAVCDHERRPKPAWDALAAACRPVIVVADPLPSPLVGGETVKLAVHVVSDARKPVDGAEVTARVTWPGADPPLTWRFGGDLEPDTVVKVGELRFTVPTTPGDLELDLTLRHDATEFTNAYRGTITEG